jgi:hypothetical protein
MRARLRSAGWIPIALAACLAGCPAASSPHDGGLDAGLDGELADDAARDVSGELALDGSRDEGAPDAAADDGGPDACPTPTTLCGATCADTSADPEHCGGCDQPCEPLPGAIAFCARGLCVPAVCRPGFGSCDGERSNGCETALDEDPLHCGRCDRVCPGAPNAEPACRRGGCLLECAPGFEDCDPATPGCECAR